MTLTDDARKIMHELSLQFGTSRTAVVERALRELRSKVLSEIRAIASVNENS